MLYFASMATDLPPLMEKERDEKREIVDTTKYQQEKLRKKEMHKAEEILDEIGQDNEKKGIAATQKAYKDYQDENFRIKSDRIFWLNTKAKFAGKKIDYYRNVDVILRYELSFLELPVNYTVKSQVTEDGIRLIMRDRWGSIHAGAFKPCGLGMYDEQACRTSVNKLDDAITKLEQHPQNGIYLQ